MSLDVDFDRAARVHREVRLDPDPHYYFMGGRRICGVTDSLTGVGINDWSDVPEDVLQAAQERGEQVHHARHLDDDDELDESSLTEEVLAHLEGWRRFRTETQFEPLLSEQLVYAPPDNGRIMLCGGTLDALGIVPNPPRLVLTDVKTGTRIPPGVGPQTAAYAEMLRMLGIADPAERWCVQTFRTGRYKVHRLANPNDAVAIASAVWIWWWKRRFVT